jgi:hypothetical protein
VHGGAAGERAGGKRRADAARRRGRARSPPPLTSLLSSHQAVIDQIYYDVTDVEPWMSGGARGASSAFVLLYR